MAGPPIPTEDKPTGRPIVDGFVSSVQTGEILLNGASGGKKGVITYSDTLANTETERYRVSWSSPVIIRELIGEVQSLSAEPFVLRCTINAPTTGTANERLAYGTGDVFRLPTSGPFRIRLPSPADPCSALDLVAVTLSGGTLASVKALLRITGVDYA